MVYQEGLSNQTATNWDQSTGALYSVASTVSSTVGTVALAALSYTNGSTPVQWVKGSAIKGASYLLGRVEQSVLQSKADLLEEKGMEGVKQLISEMFDDKSETTMKQAARIIAWLAAHRTELAKLGLDTLSAPLLERIKKVDDEGGDGLAELVRWLTTPKAEKGDNIDQPLPETESTFDALIKRLSGPEGIRTGVDQGVRLWFTKFSGNFKVPTQFQLNRRWVGLTKGRPELKRLTKVVVAQVIDQLTYKDPIDPIKVSLDITAHAVRGRVSDSEDKLTLFLAGEMPVVINRKVFERLIGLSIATALVETEKSIDSQATSGWGLICELGKDACQAWNAQSVPAADWSENRSRSLFTKSLGNNFEKLDFIPPAIRDIIGPFLIPNGYTAIPLQLSRGKPVAQNLLEKCLHTDNLVGQFDYLMGGAMASTIEELYKQGNIYDMMNDMLGDSIKGIFKKKKGEEAEEPVYSKEELEFRFAIGKLAYDLLKEFAPEWHKNLRQYPERREMFCQMAVDLVIPSIQQTLNVQMGENFTKEQLFEYAWKKTAEGLNRTESENYSKPAKRAMEQLEDFLEPVKKNTTVASFIFGFIKHLIYGATIGPIIWLIDQIVKVWSREKFEETKWYNFAHRSHRVDMEIAAEKDYEILEDQIRSDKRVRNIFDASLGKKMGLV